MESIIREVNRRGTGHCTRWKPQAFKKVVKTGERFWISAEVLVESRQKYHSPRILMSTTLKLFGSGKGDWGNWFELSEWAPGFPQFFFFIMILYCAFVEKTPSLQVHFTIETSAFVAKEEPQLAQPAAIRDVANDNEQFCAVIGWWSTSGILEMQKELKTFVFASLAHHKLYNRGAETFNFYSRG